MSGNSGIKDIKYQCKKQKSAAACNMLAGIYELRSTDKDGKSEKYLAKSIGFYKSACKLGAARACFLLAEQYLHGGMISPDHRRSVEYFEQACNRGDAISCSKLGFMHEWAVLLKKKNKASAYEYYRLSCEKGEAIACQQAVRIRHGE